MEAVSVCDGGGESSGEFRGEWWSMHLSAYFLSVKKRGKREMEGERGRAREIILLWNLDSGAHRPRSQSIWPV